MRSNIVRTFFSTAMLLIVVACKKYDEHNITFCGTSVATTQKYATGSWRLLYGEGGAGNFRMVARNNEYLILTNDRIKTGNDSIGVRLNVPLEWGEGDGTRGNCFNFKYTFSGTTPGATKVVDAIRNDTLVLHDAATDPYYYYYRRF